MNLRNRLKSFRHKHEMNQKEFAVFLEIAQTTYNQYESERRQPSLMVALQIAQKLGCSIHDIFYIEQ